MKRIISLICSVLTLIGFTCCQGNASDANKENGKEVATTSVGEYDSSTQSRSGEIPGYDESLPTLVDFSATWCGPCKQIAPFVHELAERNLGKLNVIYVDVDQDPDMANQFGVQVVPTFLLIDKEGNIIDRLEGADPDQLEAIVGRAVS